MEIRHLFDSGLCYPKSGHTQTPRTGAKGLSALVLQQTSCVTLAKADFLCASLLL